MSHRAPCRLPACLGGLLAAMVLSHAGRAQSLTDSTLQQARVVAAREGARADYAVPRQTLDTAQLRRAGVTSTADALRRFAGVNLRDYGGAGGLKTVSVRGLGAAHTTVVYDGLTQSDAQQGQTDIGRFPIERLASVALATLDDAALLAPVRNLGAATVVLTSFLPDTARHALHGTAALRQGSWDAWNGALLLGKALRHGTAFNIGADYAHGSNDYPFVLPNGVATHTERRVNSQTNDWTAEANLRQTLRGGQIDAKLFYAASHRYLPGPVTFYVNEGTEHLTEQHAFLQSRWQQTFGAWRLFAAAKADWQVSKYRDVDAQYPGGILRQHYRQREAYVTAGAAYTWRRLEAAWATDYAYNVLTSNLSTDNDVWRHTLLSALSLRYTLPRLVLTGRLQGSLYRNHAAAGSTAAVDGQRLQPTLTAVWKVIAGRRVHLSLRTAYKALFRAPTFTENYYYHLGSTTLRPERTRQWDAGMTLRLLPADALSLTLTADAYVNRVWDKISSIPYNLFVWRTVNLGKVRCAGLDMTLRAAWDVTTRHHLFLQSSYTLCSARNRTAAVQESYGKQLAYTPLHSGAASLAWENPWVNAALSVTAAAPRWATNEHTATTRVPGYADCGVSLYRTLTLGALSLDLRADLLNVLDKRYEVIRRYPMPGRAYKLSALLRF